MHDFHGIVVHHTVTIFLAAKPLIPVIHKSQKNLKPETASHALRPST